MRTAVITGGAAGLGADVARRLSEAGYRIGIFDLGAERVTQASYGATLDTREVRRQRLERGKLLAFEHQSELSQIASSPRYRKKGVAEHLGYEPTASTKKARYSSPYAAKNMKTGAKKAPIKTFQQSQAMQLTQPKPAQAYYRT